MSVKVGLNGQDFSESVDGPQFHFMDTRLSILDMSPRTGPLQGGTRVTLTGTGFSRNSTACLFGDQATPATFLTPEEIVCTSPRLAASSSGRVVKVQVTTGQTEFSVSALPFRYVAQPQLLKIDPALGPERGGTTVRVTVSGVFNSRWLSCKFSGQEGEHAVGAKFVDAKTVECPSPPHRPGIVNVTLGVNGQDYLESTLPFRYYPFMTIVRSHPSHGPAGGGSDITVFGYNFVFSSSLVCVFGSSHVPATFISTSAISCVSPPSADRSGEEVALSISGNGQDMSNSVAYKFSANVMVLALVPTRGPITGSTPVTVTGANFLNTSDLMCRFGDAVVDAVYQSDSAVICEAPPSREGSVMLQVTTNGNDFTLPGLAFTFTSSLTVTSILPISGTHNGGTLVTVFGSNFIDSSSLTCHFGTAAPVLARWVSSIQLECVSPAQSPGTASLEVSNNGQDKTNDGIKFLYAGRPVVWSLEPSHGPLRGSTKVSVSGQHLAFSNDLECRFGLVSVPASFAAGNKVECDSPRQATLGSVPFSISTNGDEVSLEDIVFNYWATPAVTEVAPVSGLSYGGNRLEIQGNHFVDTEALACKFTSIKEGEVLGIQPARFTDTTQLSCAAPENPKGGAVFVEVTTNGADFSESGVQYTYLFPPVVESILPVNGPEKGGTIVTVVGLNFVNTETLACGFANQTAPARWVSSSEIRCLAPARKPGTVALEISLNGEHFTTNNHRFQFDRQVTVSAVLPSSGPTGGGTTTVVYGTNFRATGALACQFGLDVVPARFISTNSIQCSTPAHSPGMTSLRVSLNDHDFVGLGLEFEYVMSAAIHDIRPSLGPTHGGTLVSLRGKGFVDSADLACRFGEQEAPVSFVNSSLVTCVAPQSRQGQVPVFLISNGLKLTDGMVSYR